MQYVTLVHPPYPEHPQGDERLPNYPTRIISCAHDMEFCQMRQGWLTGSTRASQGGAYCRTVRIVPSSTRRSYAQHSVLRYDERQNTPGWRLSGLRADSATEAGDKCQGSDVPTDPRGTSTSCTRLGAQVFLASREDELWSDVRRRDVDATASRTRAPTARQNVPASSQMLVSTSPERTLEDNLRSP
ncbi:hypothetical protein OBBRIDRAFT_792698 [Obba rivulosa]|uniref:Uncharacterized protein n=1 Tax=Obba rivulosa TaxID=1052685 RepID=A0A8E2AZR5_9APHY|nr:hypothetical protein OBBRIDRAFT_792698 [Obba rivulosa]